MKQIKAFIILMATLLFVTLIYPEPPDTTGLDVVIGNVRIPRPFVHAGKDYQGGTYYMTLKNNPEGIPYFYIHNAKKELLFEELAVIKPYSGKSKKFKLHVKKEMLKGYEYYRVKIFHPEKEIIAFFLVKPKPVTKVQPPTGQETPPDKKTEETEKI